MTNLDAPISCPKCGSFRFVTQGHIITQEYFIKSRPACALCHYKMSQEEITERFTLAIKKALSGR